MGLRAWNAVFAGLAALALVIAVKSESSTMFMVFLVVGLAFAATALVLRIILLVKKTGQLVGMVKDLRDDDPMARLPAKAPPPPVFEPARPLTPVVTRAPARTPRATQPPAVKLERPIELVAPERIDASAPLPDEPTLLS